MRSIGRLTLALSLISMPNSVFAQTSSVLDIIGTPYVTDGDTIVINGIPIRLEGIDAPETEQVCLLSSDNPYPCGISARDYLVKRIENQTIRCVGAQKDRYKRRLSFCYLGEIDLNAEMVKSGRAISFIRYSHKYVKEEKTAREQQVGLWSGAFIAPWDWRSRTGKTIVLGALSIPIEAQKQFLMQESVSKPPVPGCEIKGNISRKKERIYHVPGQEYYLNTIINERNGERWFCTEEEAKAAGWRRSKI